MADEVHKDFHGGLSYGIEFLEREYGGEGLDAFFSSLARTVYSGLTEDLKTRGLVALEEHWRRVFTLEAGEFDMAIEDSVLVLRVHACPAIHHMKTQNYRIAPRFCEHTRIVNSAICRAAGYETSVEYDQERGSCVQRFWRAGG